MDDTHDISRVFRIPGTYNRKLEPVRVRVLHQNPDDRYRPRDFEPYLVEPPPEEPEEAMRSRRPRTVGLAPDLSRLSQRMRDLIRYGNDGGYESRSEADFAACLAMFGVGFSEAEVWAAMTDPTNGISEKFLEKGPQGERYLALTIGKAKARAQNAPRLGWSRVYARRKGVVCVG